MLIGFGLAWPALLRIRPDLLDRLTMKGIGLAIRADLSAAARRMAVANALEGMTRAEAARLAGLGRQALRAAVVHHNAEGLQGLHDRPRPGAKPRLDDKQRARLRQIVLDGPDAEGTGLSAWTLAELCGEVKRRWGGGGLPRGAHVQADAQAWPAATESPPAASQGRSGGP